MKTSSLVYTLGKSLYIPLTSRSNCLTLPQTRGPNFQLPNSVISSLMHVRNLEGGTETAMPETFNFNLECVEDGKSRMPELPFNSNKVPSKPIKDEEGMNPSIDLIFSEIREYQSEHKDISAFVFAGEGEPTLRLNSLLALSQRIQESLGTNDDDDDDDDDDDRIPIRLVTNGLVLANLFDVDRKNVLNHLKKNGVNELSIALMTSCAEQYEMLMQPTSHKDDVYGTNKNWHTRLCEMIQDATNVGLDIECTGVDRDFVDKAAAEELAKSLGASVFRWRPYFP